MSASERYSRHSLLSQIGREGQEKLISSSVAVIGCGALGTVIANTLVRAGVGHVRIVDRDFVEWSNLQRQVLFDEEDVVSGLPKAVAAANKLRRINSSVDVEAVVDDVNPGNVEAMIAGVDVVLDGTDNFETRFLINDACVKLGLPWIYGAVVATYGMSMAIIPHRTPCFRCLLGQMPAPGSRPTCDTVGVLGPAVSVIASLQVTEALKLLVGREQDLHGKLVYFESWGPRLEQFEVGKRDTPCPACDLGHYEFLQGKIGTHGASLCGRDAVQLRVREEREVHLPELAQRLEAIGEVAFNPYMLRLRVDAYELSIFPDGRAIVKGTSDENVARSLYARYIGA